LTTLTKIFIVVLAFFAIIISVLIVQFTATNTNYKKLADDWQSQFKQEQALRLASDNQQKINESYLNKVIDMQRDELAKMQTAKNEQATELANVKTSLLAEQQKNASLTGQNNQLTNMINAADAERKQLQSQIDIVRKDNAGLRADNFKLSETNQKLDLQRQLYEQEIRLLKEQNFSLAEKLEKQRSRGPVSASAQESLPAGANEKASAATETESAPIIGQVTDVRDSLASISIGSAQGVKDGMEFIIYRNSQFLGKLRVNKVLPDQAAGELLQRQGNIQAGDKVTDKFQF